MNNIMDLIDFERRGEYVLADVKSATRFFDRGEYVLVDVKSATWFFECANCQYLKISTFSGLMATQSSSSKTQNNFSSFEPSL
jgi:hypothetical protein